jgi:hypothetical protein
MQKRRTRMYEPWGYREENNYQSSENIREDDLSSFFAGVEYKRSDNKIHFSNKDGEEVGTLNVNDFIKSDQIVEKAWYEDGKIYVKFTNGDLITVDVKELLDENEFKEGLQVVDGIVSVLKDPASEKWLTISENGVKVDGIQAEIDRLDGRIDDETSRATSEESRIEAKLDAEITRSTDEDARLDGKIDDETTRAKEAEAGLSRRIDTLNDELDREEARAQAAEQELSTRLTTEIADRKADVDEEEARAKAAEEALQEAIDDETARATSAETALQTAIDNEAARATAAEGVLQTNIDNEASRATSAETDLQGAINDEATRAQGVEDSLNDKIDAAVSSITDAVSEEVADRKAEAVASAAYDESAKTINFLNANGAVISSVDATDFIKDGMIESVKIENGNLVITFNTESGKEPISIPLSDIFNPNNYYTKDEINEKVSTINDNISDEASARESGDTALDGKIDALEAVVDTKANTTDVNAALGLKADKTEIPTDFYTQEEVDTMLAEKQAEIDKIISDYKKLKEIVGDLGGDVEYSVPADGKLTDMLKKSGIIKLTEDVESNTYTGGITSKNITTLNLGGKTITTTANTTTNPSIMARGTQQFTIQGSGTLNANGHIAIEANGENAVITLGGTAFGKPTYVTNREGELIYCYLGTINITNGVFRNDNDNKAFLLNCYDANYKNGTAKIVVTGGKFYDFDPANNTSEGEGTSYVPEGYVSVESTETIDGVEHKVYTVKKA